MCWIVLASCAFVLGADHGIAAQLDGRAYQLRQVAVRTLPPQVRLNGVTARSADLLVGWSYASGAIWLIAEDSAWTFRDDEIRPLWASPVPGDSIVEIVTTEGALAEYGLDGARLRERDLDLPVRAEAATSIGGDWYVAGHGVRGYEVYHVERDDRTVARLTTLPPRTGEGGTTVGTYLTATSSSVAVAEVRRPFGAMILSRSGEVLAQSGFTPQEPSTVATEPADDPSWIGLPLIPALEGEYLQILSDLRSDRRLLLLRGPDARVLEQSPIELPLGLFSRMPGTDLVLGIRNFGSPELVIYELISGSDRSPPLPPASVRPRR